MQRFKKLRIDDLFAWDSHRGGWKYTMRVVQSEFHAPDGTLFLSSVEDAMILGKPIEEPWVGFIHQVPRHHYERYPDLERVLRNATWLKSLNYCRGIFTLSNYLKDYLDRRVVGISVNYVPYAIDLQFKEFNYDEFLNRSRKVVFIGEYLRNFQAFYDLPTNKYEKLLLSNKGSRKANLLLNPSVKVLDRLSDSDYDQMLSESIVFLNLFDAPANTTVVECLGRNTPILINKLPGVVDYLGENYPFYYSSLDEASKKLSDDTLIEQTWRYLMASKNKEKLSMEYFVNTIHQSPIYKALQIPDSQKN